MRLFTALDIPDAFQDALMDLQNDIRLPARWSDPDQFHITLRFIGEVTRAEASRIEKTLTQVNVTPARCCPYGLDVLPSRRAPRVMMVGLERTDSLLSLYNAISERLEGIGLEPEDRKYRPHVTLGRLDNADRNAVHDTIQAHKERSFPSFVAQQFVLYESTLQSDGAVHEPLTAYPLTD